MKKFTFDGNIGCQIPHHVLPANHVLLVQSGVLDSLDLQAMDRARANDEVIMVRLKPKYTDGLKRDKKTERDKNYTKSKQRLIKRTAFFENINDVAFKQ